MVSVHMRTQKSWRKSLATISLGVVLKHVTEGAGKLNVVNNKMGGFR